MKFQDCTSYSQGDKERIPTAFELKTDSFRIYITCGHIHYKGEWIMHCSALGIDTLHLKECISQKDAEQKALRIVEFRANRILNDIAKIKEAA